MANGAYAPPVTEMTVPIATTPAAMACAAAECGHPGGVRCRYRDRNGTECATTWCLVHVAQARGRDYCRRHAGVVRALPEGVPLEDALPPVTNRALSLLRWTGDTLDPLLRRILEHAHPEGVILVDPARAVRDYGTWVWRRSWEVTGRDAQVSVDLDVAEEDDAVLVARVDAAEVSRLTPPWVTDRTDDPQRDQDQRRRFYGAVVTAVRLAVAARMSARV